MTLSFARFNPDRSSTLTVLLFFHPSFRLSCHLSYRLLCLCSNLFPCQYLWIFRRPLLVPLSRRRSPGPPAMALPSSTPPNKCCAIPDAGNSSDPATRRKVHSPYSLPSKYICRSCRTPENERHSGRP